MGGMSGAREPLQPIFIAHLFPELEAQLIELLRGLSPEDWEKQTLAPKWKVKDVAAHLLDTQVRKLAAARHGYKPENSKKLSPDQLVALINHLNAEGVRAVQPIEPGRIDFVDGVGVAGQREVSSADRSVCSGDVSCELGGRGRVRELV